MKSDQARKSVSTLFELMNSRAHVSPKRLGPPGPNSEQRELILSAAGTAPIHGVGIPWHIYEISEKYRHLLGNIFVENLKTRDPNASSEQINDAYSKALRGPYLLLVVARHGEADFNIPWAENIISAGCAIQNILLAAHAMDLGAGISTGKALYGPEIKSLFRLNEDDEPLVFITIGSVIKHRDRRERPIYKKYSSSI